MRNSLIVAALLLASTPAYSADFTCASGNVGCLISAIQVANSNGQYNDIFLEQGTYTLTAVNNDTVGFNGLPSITGRSGYMDRTAVARPSNERMKRHISGSFKSPPAAT